jgi:hypothetical protein
MFLSSSEAFFESNLINCIAVNAALLKINFIKLIDIIKL